MRGLRSLLHGFVCVEAAGFFRGLWDVDTSYEKLVASILEIQRRMSKVDDPNLKYPLLD